MSSNSDMAKFLIAPDVTLNGREDWPSWSIIIQTNLAGVMLERHLTELPPPPPPTPPEVSEADKAKTSATKPEDEYTVWRREESQNKEKSRAGIKVNAEEMYVNPMCINASNAYHQCTENCLQRNKKRIQIKEGKRVQNGEIRERVVGEKYVDSKHTSDTGITVQNGEIREEVVGEKYVDSKNTSDTGITVQNGEITEEVVGEKYLVSKKTPGTKRQSMGGNPEGSMEYMKIGENRNVDPRCVNASNPYHKCGKYCLQREHKMGLVAGGKPEGNKGGLKKVERTDVNPRCRHGTNPYHKCSDHCLQRIKGAT